MKTIDSVDKQPRNNGQSWYILIEMSLTGNFCQYES